MDTELFGEIAAETFLDRLDSLSGATSGDETSSKHVVDYLTFDERRALFDALSERCGGRVEVVSEEGERFELETFELGTARVIPFLVDELDLYDGSHRNVGSGGFSCALRDYFSVGSRQPRILVTLTERGNETQDSARETEIDRQLLSLEALCDQLVVRHGFGCDSRMRTLVERYLVHVSETLSWAEVLGRLDDFLDAVEDEPLETWGAELGRLEVFLPDEVANPIDGERFDLTGDERNERLADTCRLDDNAARRAFVEDVFQDRLNRTRDRLEQQYDDESVEAILERGIEGDDGIEADEPIPRPDPTTSKIHFEWSGLEVEGASQWQRRSGDDAKCLVVTAEDDVEIRAPLDREFNPDRDYVHLFARDRNNDQRTRFDDRAEAEGREAVAEIPNEHDFAIFKLALADGPRTFKMTDDDFYVVLAKAEASVESIAWETGVELSFQHQAWVRRGETSTFKVGDANRTRPESIERGDGDLRVVDDAPPTYDDAIVEEVSFARLHDGRLPVQIAWVREERTESTEGLDLLAYAPYEASNREDADALLESMRARRRDADETYLQAISDVTREGDDEWNVELSSQVRATVRRWNDHGQEEAVAHLMRHPTSVHRLERSDGELESKSWPARTKEALASFLEVRADLFEELLADSPAILEGDDGEPTAVSPWLTDLTAHREVVEGYLEAWLGAVDGLGSESGPFEPIHEALLRLDTLEQRNASGDLERLTVLPTHPWSMAAMLRFQQKVAELYDTSADSTAMEEALTREELEAFAPRRILEDWYTSDDEALRAEDGTPFCMEFLPTSTFERSGRLDYVSRVVRRKIGRYLRMHDHLRDARRTFRLAFVHPGDADALLEGLRSWFRKQHGSDDTWLERIPTVEISLFEGEDAGRTDNAFDDFFRRYLESSEEADAVEEAMLAKLRYRRRSRSMPEPDDFHHVCFARGLVEERHPRQAELDPESSGSLEVGWDGSFAEGMMATYLRQPRRSGDGIDRTRRGLWVRGDDPMRRGLASMLQLVEGQRTTFYNPGIGPFWDAELPSLETLSELYDRGDWVVHLDRELNLAMFHGDNDDTRIIEYSDQEDPTQPGFDLITVTERAQPYVEQLENVLKLVGLRKPSRETSVSSDPDRAREAVHALLEEINTLSGTWALDFLEGNVSEEGAQHRLKGMVGASLVYRWLRRVEEPKLLERFDGRLVPVYISLEDLIRATPASGLPTGPGLVDRYGKDDQYCDDLLALYLQAPPEDPEAPLELFGRIIEVKFGRSVADASTRQRGIDQVRSAHSLMSETMAGGDTLLEAPIRHRQLAMLVKSQLEQARARGLLGDEQLRTLDLERLSSRLASGRYRVSYDLQAEQRRLYGDLFLLSTSTTDDVPEDEPRIQHRDGVRTIELGRRLLRNLAHASDASSTLYGTLESTLPHLGPPGRGPEDDDSLVSIDGDSSESSCSSEESEVDDDEAETEADGDETDPDVGGGGTASGTNDGSDPEGGIDTPPKPDVDPDEAPPPLEETGADPIVDVRPDRHELQTILDRIERVLESHGLELAEPPSTEEVDFGPRVMRVYIRPRVEVKMSAIERRSEDIALHVGTTDGSDIRMEKAAGQRGTMALDLPISDFSYEVDYRDVVDHPSFASARAETTLGFCAGIRIDGTPHWVDLADMPHMLVGGATGSGKTVFLNNLVMTLALQRSTEEVDLRLATSKAYDFAAFTELPHANDTVITPTTGTRRLVDDLVGQMERRNELLRQAKVHKLDAYNDKVRRGDVDGTPLPHVVAVVDEYAGTIKSFDDTSERKAFERGVTRLAQEARATGIHLVLCMQRPDADVVEGNVKSNITHRFALKLASHHDSQVILDQKGAETLLGQGDMLYMDERSRLERLQVPLLEGETLHEFIDSASSSRHG